MSCLERMQGAGQQGWSVSLETLCWPAWCRVCVCCLLVRLTTASDLCAACRKTDRDSSSSSGDAGDCVCAVEAAWGAAGVMRRTHRQAPCRGLLKTAWQRPGVRVLLLLFLEGFAVPATQVHDRICTHTCFAAAFWPSVSSRVESPKTTDQILDRCRATRQQLNSSHQRHYFHVCD